MAIFRAAVCLLALAAAAAKGDKPDPSQCPPIDEEGKDVMFPNPDDCGTYYLCTYGRLVLMTCPPGLHFSPSSLRCDFPSIAGCVTKAPVKPFTSAPPGECPAHDVEGQDVLYPNPDDCTTYYLCNEGKHVLMHCPAGLHYNAALQQCDYPDQAGCEARLRRAAEPSCPPPGSGSDILLFPKPDNCSEYYKCDNGNLLIEACPPGLHFNPEAEVCDHPWAAGCQKRAIPLAKVARKPKVAKAVPSCPPPGSGNDILLFPKPDNCSEYYKCDNGNLLTEACPPGLHFNAELEVCDHPWAANCHEQRSRPLPRRVKVPVMAVARPVASAEPSCPPPGSGSDILLFPKPDNCSEYYKCDNGNLLVEACPPGLHFNPEAEVCDHPWAAGCQKRRSDPVCRPPGSGGNLEIFPSPDNCEQFLTCDNGHIVVNDCPPGLHFNPNALACDHPWAAGCQNLRLRLR